VSPVSLFLLAAGVEIAPAWGANLTPGLLRQMKISPRVAACARGSTGIRSLSPTHTKVVSPPLIESLHQRECVAIPFNKSLVFSIGLHISRQTVGLLIEARMPTNAFIFPSVLCVTAGKPMRGKSFSSLQRHAPLHSSESVS
jgi:hypothetical protein